MLASLLEKALVYFLQWEASALSNPKMKVSSMIPKVNVSEVSQDIIGVETAMLAAIQTFGNATVALFLERDPERGEQLWMRAKAFQKQFSGKTFSDFIKHVVTADLLKLFYPKECTLDQAIQKLLVSEIQSAIAGAVHSNNDVLGVYFGEGHVYQTARRISCKGCPVQGCRHYL